MLFCSVMRRLAFKLPENIVEPDEPRMEFSLDELSARLRDASPADLKTAR